MGSEVFMDKFILTKREKEVFTLLVNNKTTKDIAEILGIHYQTVRKLIQNGELKAKKIGKGYIVTSENLKQYVSNND